MLAEEVLRVVYRAVLRFGDIFEVKARYVEHFARALAVARCDKGGVSVEEAALMEEAVDSVSRFGANAEYSLVRVGSGTEMGDSTEKFERSLFLLYGEFGS